MGITNSALFEFNDILNEEYKLMEDIISEIDGPDFDWEKLIEEFSNLDWYVDEDDDGRKYYKAEGKINGKRFLAFASFDGFINGRISYVVKTYLDNKPYGHKFYCNNYDEIVNRVEDIFMELSLK